VFSRFRPSTFGLRLKPRGELFVSLLAIGLAVAFPAMALVWTTVRALDRDRREWSQELQALHRFRLEEALRTLDTDLKARAARAGHRSPAKPSEAGALFRDLLGVTGAEPSPEGLPDGLLVLAEDGTPLYPAPAIGTAHPPEIDLRGESLVGAFHQRLLTESMSDAYLGLASRLVEQNLEGSRSPSGRLYLPGIQLAALQQMSPDDPRFGATLEALTSRVTQHGAPLMPASQRLFLWRELRKLGAPGSLPTESAEELGLVVVQSLVGNPTRENRALMTVRLSDDGPGQEVFLLPAPGGGVIWLYRQERLHRDLEARANRSLAPLGYRAQLVSIGSPAPSAAVLQASLGEVLPGWELRLDTSVATAELDRSARRQSAFQIASAASAVVLGAVLAVLAVRRFLERVRLAEVRHDFLTTVSHELRTPMTSIRMLIDSLVADPDLQPDRTRSYLEVVSRETSRLGRLVDDYLTFARLERGGMNYDFQPTAPETVAEAAARSVEPRFAAPGCDFRIEVADGLPRVWADAPSLTTALLNLLENAHKYTGIDKRILLTLTRCGTTVCFAVTDNGRGFDPRHRSRIFEKFHRLEASGGAVTGAGLGLHIVKSIVAAHGGRVEVETTPGEGSRFAIHVPVVPDEPSPSAHSDES
jgi:signal transduction histidine kinase